MSPKQAIITHFKEEGCRMDIDRHAIHYFCWLWRDDRIVGLGIDRSEIGAMERAQKCLQDGELL